MSNSFETPWTAAQQAPLSTGLSRQEHCSGLPFPPPGALSNPGMELQSPALASGFFYHLSHQGRLFAVLGCGEDSLFLQSA